MDTRLSPGWRGLCVLLEFGYHCTVQRTTVESGGRDVLVQTEYCSTARARAVPVLSICQGPRSGVHEAPQASSPGRACVPKPPRPKPPAAQPKIAHETSDTHGPRGSFKLRASAHFCHAAQKPKSPTSAIPIPGSAEGQGLSSRFYATGSAVNFRCRRAQGLSSASSTLSRGSDCRKAR